MDSKSKVRFLDAAGAVGETVTFSGKGTVYSYTTVLSAPEGFAEQAPYHIALVELDEGPLVTAQLTDLGGEPEIGMRVEMVTRKLRTDGEEGIIVYGYKFRKPISPQQEDSQGIDGK